jgi:hypothetical protein
VTIETPHAHESFLQEILGIGRIASLLTSKHEELCPVTGKPGFPYGLGVHGVDRQKDLR